MPAGSIDPHVGDQAGRRIVLLFGRHDASVSLYFDGLRHRQIEFRFHEPSSPEADRTALSEADAVILVRDLDRFAVDGTLTFLSRAEIPHFYFVDDSFQTLRRSEPAFWAYGAARYRSMLAATDGVFVTSPALVEEFRPLHPRIMICNLCVDPDLLATPHPNSDADDPGMVRVALPGGCFRSADFNQRAGPALIRLATQRPVTLIARRGCHLANVGVPTISVESERSFPRFIGRWRAERPTLLLHPRAATANDRYKTPNALLVALYLGVPLVVADGEPAYDGLNESDGVLRAASEDDWRNQIVSAHTPGRRQELMKALRASCLDRFAGTEQASALSAFLNGAGRLTPQLHDTRRARASLATPLLAKRWVRSLRSTIGRAGHRVRLTFSRGRFAD